VTTKDEKQIKNGVKKEIANGIEPLLYSVKNNGIEPLMKVFETMTESNRRVRIN
jgi:hypothetical protein